MSFKLGKALDHAFKGKSNQALNPLSTNVDVNQSFGSRIFSDDAFGGQSQMEDVLTKMDKHKNPWKYDQSRLDEVKKYDDEVTGYVDAMKNEKDTATLDALRTGKKEAEENLIKAKATRDGDPGFFSTAGGVAKGTLNAMNTGSAGQVAAKWGAAAGVYMVANGTGRAATGGGVTYNSRGQRDIMGVPLI